MSGPRWDPMGRGRAILASVEAQLAELVAPVSLETSTSYAMALHCAIRKAPLEIDGLAFEPVADSTTEEFPVPGGHRRYGRLYRLAGTDKTYRVTVEPVAETHGGRP